MTPETRLMRKVDFYIFPLVFMIYMLNFLDRTK